MHELEVAIKKLDEHVEIELCSVVLSQFLNLVRESDFIGVDQLLICDGT